MNIDLNSLAVELSTFEKTATPPRLYNKLRSWLRRIKSGRVTDLQQIIARKAEDLNAVKALAKNELMASFYDSGIMKMDFGSEVPDPIKKAALKWAKNRGLKVIEATLAKTKDAPTSYILNAVDEIVPHGVCLKRRSWSVTPRS